MTKTKVAGLAVLLMTGAMSLPANAADLGGNCCADLEERIAELEATTVRKGNRKVSLTLSGQVSQSIMWWDDGHEKNTYVVSNFGNPSYISLAGEAKIHGDVSAGFNILHYIDQVYSGNTGQLSDDATVAGGPWFFWHTHWWIKSDKYGKVSLGQASRATDLAPEQDLSGSLYDPSYSLMNDWGFSFFLRRKDGGLVGTDNLLVFQGNIAGYSYTGETGNLVRYDSPTWQGFTFVASWGEDDMTDVALFYSKDHGPFSVAASVGYSHVTDENGLGVQYFNVPENPGPTSCLFDLCRIETDTWLGSISVLHNPSGLSLTVAGGQREYGGTRVADTDTILGVTTDLRTPEESSFIYAKLGMITKFSHLGNTNFYAEYGHYKDGLTVGVDPLAVGDLSVSGNQALVCAGAGNACRVVGTEADIWGIGVVQLIDAASMAIHLGYRHWTYDVDLVDVNGNAVPTTGLEDFHSVMGGSRITF